MTNDTHIIYFDGVCNLCNGFVQFLIRHDKEKRFAFAPLQSEAGKKMLLEFDKSVTDFDSVVYVVDQKPLEKSTAALHILRTLGGIWSIAIIFKVVPRFLRDWVYDIVASNRYRWFGKRIECMVPTPELKDRFLA